jgi:NADH-quinone oxidoreductase subunit J
MPQEFEINMLRCIFCGFCQEVCPEEAIFLQKDYSLTGTSRAEMIYNKEKLLALGGTHAGIQKWKHKLKEAKAQENFPVKVCMKLQAPTSNSQKARLKLQSGRTAAVLLFGNWMLALEMLQVAWSLESFRDGNRYSFTSSRALHAAVRGAVVANPFSRNPVTSAMFLVLTIISMAGLFVLLHAFFLAAVQILVYAGAVMVLFLFVIMLLDLKEEERRKIKKTDWWPAWFRSAPCIAIFVRSLLATSRQGMTNPTAVEGDTARSARLLFTKYLLPFEIVSILLLVAMVGVILLSKKDLK